MQLHVDNQCICTKKGGQLRAFVLLSCQQMKCLNFIVPHLNKELGKFSEKKVFLFSTLLFLQLTSPNAITKTIYVDELLSPPPILIQLNLVTGAHEHRTSSASCLVWHGSCPVLKSDAFAVDNPQGLQQFWAGITGWVAIWMT